MYTGAIQVQVSSSFFVIVDRKHITSHPQNKLKQSGALFRVGELNLNHNISWDRRWLVISEGKQAEFEWRIVILTGDWRRVLFPFPPLDLTESEIKQSWTASALMSCGIWIRSGFLSRGSSPMHIPTLALNWPVTVSLMLKSPSAR